MSAPRRAKVHQTAIVEPGVFVGAGTQIWDSVHIRTPARIGSDCTIGEKTYVAYGVEIGDRVKINAFVYLCTGVTVEDGVMIAAGAVFTNDRYPRATTNDLATLRSSEPDEHTLPTAVRVGATIGASAVIGPGLEIGRFAMVGMGAVVTRSVPEFHLVSGNPARTVAAVCRCGTPIARAVGDTIPNGEATCSTCLLRYLVRDGTVTEVTG